MVTPIVSPARAPSNALLDAALQFASRGWSVVPAIGKRPAGLWRPFQQRPADEATLRKLFAKPGITGLAIVTGAVSGGLAVRDFDDAGAYRRWADDNPDLAAAMPTARTYRGFHVYGRLAAENFINFGDGELRADSKHYVVAPPSIHPEGTVYTWLVPPRGDLSLLPPSLIGKDMLLSTAAAAAAAADSRKPSKSIAWLTSAVETAIKATLPSGPGKRNRAVFQLARRLKEIRPDATPDELRAIVAEWHRRALPTIQTKEFAETWSDFAVAWEPGRIKRPVGVCLAKAVADADAIPGWLMRRLDDLAYDGQLRRLAALCWHLQQQWGDRPFPLAGKVAGGRFLGVSEVHAGRLLKTLRFDGLIERTSEGSKATPGKPGLASEYRFFAHPRQPIVRRR
jgi:hypothetical protein